MNSDDPLKVIASVQGQFEKLTKGSAVQYLSDVVERCLHDVDGAREHCQALSSMWDNYLHEVQDALSSVLQEYGCGLEYDMANEVRSDVRHVIGLLTKVEELLMLSPSQLGDWHALRRLAYQNCD